MFRPSEIGVRWETNPFPEKKYTELHSRLDTLWAEFECGTTGITSNKLLKSCSYIYARSE